MARKKKSEEPKVEEQPVVEEVIEKPKRVRKKKEPIADTNADTNHDTIPEKPRVRRTRKKKVVEEPKVEEQPINPLVMNLSPQKDGKDGSMLQSLCMDVGGYVTYPAVEDDGFTIDVNDSNKDNFIEMFSEMLGNKAKPTKLPHAAPSQPKSDNLLGADLTHDRQADKRGFSLKLF